MVKTPYDPALLAAMQQAGMQGLGKMGPDWTQNMVTLSREWLRFTSDRFQEDVALQKKLMECRTPEELQAVQSAYFNRAISSYKEEADLMRDLTRKLFSEEAD